MHTYRAHDPAAFRPYTAEGMVEQLARCFEAAAARGRS
jgi:hypothetical protein